MKRKKHVEFPWHHSTHIASEGHLVHVLQCRRLCLLPCPAFRSSLCHHEIVTVSWGLIAVPYKQNMVVSITMRQYLFWISDSRCSYLKTLKANLPQEARPKKRTDSVDCHLAKTLRIWCWFVSRLRLLEHYSGSSDYLTCQKMKRIPVSYPQTNPLLIGSRKLHSLSVQRLQPSENAELFTFIWHQHRMAVSRICLNTEASSMSECIHWESE